MSDNTMPTHDWKVWYDMYLIETDTSRSLRASLARTTDALDLLNERQRIEWARAEKAEAALANVTAETKRLLADLSQARALYLETLDRAVKAEAERNALKSPVTWKQWGNEESDTWECLGCGETTVWEDSPEENVNFCSGCGHPVVFQKYIEPVEDEE